MTPTDLRDRAVTRRCALLGVGGVGAAAVLAACSSGGGDDAAATSSAPSSATATSPSAASSAPASSGAASSPAASSPAAGGAAIASLSDIPVGGTAEVQVDGKNVLLSQPSAGTVEAFSSVCPHQGGEVKPDGAGFLCSLHKSEFAIDGSVTKGPARSDLESIAVTVSGDSVVEA